MNRSLVCAVVFSLPLVAAAATDAPVFAPGYNNSINQFPVRVLPVLVQVDSHGKVTDASPAYELSPQFDRLLTQNLDQMITAPASDKHGRAIPSQFVMNLALHTTPRNDGNFDTQFAYVSTQPVPSGQWYWRHVDGYRLELVSRDNLQRDAFRYDRSTPNWSGSRYTRDFQRTSAPAIRQAPAAAPSAPAPTNPGHSR